MQKQDLAGTVQHLWDGQNILLDTSPGNIIQGVYTLEPAVYGNLISQSRGFPGVDSFYLFDASGSTRQLVSITGVNVTDSYLYDAFGNVLAGDLVAGTTNPFRYIGRQGYYYDMYWNGSVAEYLQYYLRARIYNPATGRFLSRDPLGIPAIIGAVPLRTNLYIYAISNPVNLVDPSGLDALSDRLCPLGQPTTCILQCGVTACAWARLLEDIARESGDIGSGHPRLPGNENDAIRHCNWQCMIAKKVGPKGGECIGYIHEICADNMIEQIYNGHLAMDLHNNAVGQACAGPGASDCTCFGCCLDACQFGQTYCCGPHSSGDG